MSICRIRKAAILWLATVLLLAAGCRAKPLTSDADLMESFHQHRNTFERLRQMAYEDNLDGSIGRDFVGDKELAGERVEEYRNLMRQARVDRFDGYSRAKVYFWVDWYHSAFGGRTKGIAYFPQQPQLLVRDSLDESCLPLVTPGADTCAAVRHIEGNWWLIRGDAG
jgi:hypothetical protein